MIQEGSRVGKPMSHRWTSLDGAQAVVALCAIMLQLAVRAAAADCTVIRAFLMSTTVADGTAVPPPTVRAAAAGCTVFFALVVHASLSHSRYQRTRWGRDVHATNGQKLSARTVGPGVFTNAEMASHAPWTQLAGLARPVKMYGQAELAPGRLATTCRLYTYHDVPPQ